MYALLYVLVAFAFGIWECSAALLNCVYLNDCGTLGERLYDPLTTLANPEVINYKDVNVTLSNNVTFAGRRFSFSQDVNPSLPYLGVWIIPKAIRIYVIVNNLSPINPVNLHWHGLHVKGTGADDPGLTIAPKTSYTYTIPISSDHAGGTFWIHPHYHTQGIQNIAGCALGMVILQDDQTDREIPAEIRQAPYFNMIIQMHQPNFWTPPNIGVSEFPTVNGVANNPILRLTAMKWLRLRILSTAVSFADLVYGSFDVPQGTTCSFVLIAKDGVYLRTPRYLPPPYQMIFTEATRLDVMVRCDGVAGTQIQMNFNGRLTFRLELASRPPSVSPDDFEILYKACLPSYLNDTFNDVVQPNSVQLTPYLTFTGMQQSDALATFSVGQTVRMLMNGYGHPFHTHVNHFQIVNTDPTGWFQQGDWHDTAQNVIANMRLSRWTQLLFLHCHNINHQETFNVNGMMSLIWVTGVDGADSSFRNACPSVVTMLEVTVSPTTQRPSSQAPTRRPTKPTRALTTKPTRALTTKPTAKTLTSKPTLQPTAIPTSHPPSTTEAPNPFTSAPGSSAPSRRPSTSRPSRRPTISRPSRRPTTSRPSRQPTTSTSRPSRRPSTSRPSRRPTTSRPSRRPRTSRPSKAPTYDPTCRKYPSDACSSIPNCYVFQPSPEIINSTISKLPRAQQTLCLSEIGCRASQGRSRCSYKCLQMCKLDENCKVKRVRRKNVCAAKPTKGRGR